MTSPHPRPVILRARRDTLALVALATMSTFALSHVVHSRRIAVASNEHPRGWTGGLADVAASDVAPHVTEPLTSASLVVPELALPQAPVRPLVRLRGCAGDSCLSPPAKIADSPIPPRKLAVDKPATDAPRRVASIEARAAARGEKPSLMSRLNPFAKLPDTSTIKRPFVFASDAVSGWFKRF